MNASAFVVSVSAPVHSALAAKPFLCGRGPVHAARLPRSALLTPRWFACAEAAAGVDPVSKEEPSAVADPVAAEEPTAAADPVAEASESTGEGGEEDADLDGVSAVAAEAEAQEDAPRTDRRRRRRSRPRREVTLPLEVMEVGMELEGTVKSVTDYGAFVGDFGTPTDGLLHVSQLAAGYVEKVSDIVSVGQKVKVRVLSVDMDKGNFSLTMKTPEELESGRRQPDGDNRRGNKDGRREEQTRKWTEFKYDPKEFIDAKVTSITDFGGFCQLLTEDGEVDGSAPTEGLIHISELSEDRVEKVQDVLKVGQAIKVRVTHTDKKRNRISMSLKQWAEPKMREEAEEKDIAKGIEAANENQPAFKSSFELAFERAKGVPQ